MSDLMPQYESYYFSAIALTMTKDRNEVISFTIPTATDYHVLIIRNPLDSFNWGSYVESLKYSVWLMIGVFCIVMPFFIYITAK